jgi:hypothetical protein
VQTYLDYVRREAAGHNLLVEQRLGFGDIIGVPDQFGTSDAVILRADGRASIIDLKYGRGVKVEAENNEQLLIYGIAAIAEYAAFGFDFKELVLTIHQPRLDHVDEWVVSMPTIEAFQRDLVEAVGRVQAPEPAYNPGEKQCRWCAKKAGCPALAKKVAETVGVDFDNLDEPLVPVTEAVLAQKMAAIPLIEDWCSAVRAAVETGLLAGHAIPGWKLVEGKRGARSWADEKAAEELLRKKFRLTIEEAYNLKLISPTQAEKLLKDSPRRWTQLEPLIGQSSGKPSVAPESDKRPAYSVANNFDNLEEK